MARRVRRFLRGAAMTFCLALTAWAGGLAWFLGDSLTMPTDRASVTDAIVVLTGGRLRLETGLGLLGAGKARTLFVSGVNPRVERSDLLRTVGPVQGVDAGRVVLGHAADNTLGNARETAEWMHRQGYRSLRLVTSWYHMRRSLLEFARAMPGLTIIPDPVAAMRGDGGARWLDVTLLVTGEYNKYLVTLVWPGAGAAWPSFNALRPVAAAEHGRRS
jgi:uncharacterized SAM-binding protein YcdF (DUF218 family)